jgi:FMN-dependent dehydrogenase
VYRHVRKGFAPPSHFSSARQVRSVSSAFGKLAGEDHRASSAGCRLAMRRRPCGVAADQRGRLSLPKGRHTGIPMMASTLSVDPLEEVAAEFGETPGFFQLYTPTDRALAESLVQRAEVAGFKKIVVTLDTWITEWRPRDLTASNFPQLRGHCLANSTSNQVFGARLANAPEADMRAAMLEWARIFGNPLTLARPALDPVDHQPADHSQGHPASRRHRSRQGRRRRRHLLLQPRRSLTRRRSCRVGRAPSRGDRSRWSAGVVRLGSA